MTRREFLAKMSTVGPTALLLPAAVSSLALGGVGCDDESTSGASGMGSRTFTVATAAGHAHSVTIPQAVLGAPPAAGFTTTTSTASGHVHQVTLSQAQLAGIGGGTPANGNTTTAAGHLHGFSFV